MRKKPLGRCIQHGENKSLYKYIHTWFFIETTKSGFFPREKEFDGACVRIREIRFSQNNIVHRTTELLLAFFQQTSYSQYSLVMELLTIPAVCTYSDIHLKPSEMYYSVLLSVMGERCSLISKRVRWTANGQIKERVFIISVQFVK